MEETLEEAVEEYVKDSSHTFYELKKQCFLDGAKWQAEQDQNKYSEEDMREAIKFGLNGMYGYQFDEEGETENQISKYLQEFKKK